MPGSIQLISCFAAALRPGTSIPRIRATTDDVPGFQEVELGVDQLAAQRGSSALYSALLIFMRFQERLEHFCGPRWVLL